MHSSRCLESGSVTFFMMKERNITWFKFLSGVKNFVLKSLIIHESMNVHVKHLSQDSTSDLLWVLSKNFFPEFELPNSGL